MRLGKPELLTVSDAQRLGPRDVVELHQRHGNPGQMSFLELLGFDRVVVERAEDVYYVDRDGRAILDFFGGFGALALGHNHPRLLAARQRFQQDRRHEFSMPFLSQYVAALARNLAVIAGEELDRVLLYCTGSEAVEAALKLAMRAQPPRRRSVVYAGRSFHGKTLGALSVTDSRLYQDRFSLPGRRYRTAFGDVAALERTVRAHRDIGVLILETIQGGAGIVLPSDEYLRQVRRLCDEYGLVWIADEVQCGVGRTGRFFAFEHAGVIPDVVTLAKSLGGGKTAIAAVLARHSVHDRAYGSPKTALIHGPSTFSGMGEACATAIETLHVLYDEQLMSNAALRGDQLMRRLRSLRQRYPRLIREVRGRGLMAAIEFADVSAALPGPAGRLLGWFDRPLRGALPALIGSQLLAEFGILVAFTEYNRNVVRLEPPLTVREQHVDALADALDRLLSRGALGLARGYLGTTYRHRLASVA